MKEHELIDTAIRKALLDLKIQTCCFTREPFSRLERHCPYAVFYEGHKYCVAILEDIRLIDELQRCPLKRR
jgi:hypothetical protein